MVDIIVSGILQVGSMKYSVITELVRFLYVVITMALRLHGDVFWMNLTIQVL